MSSVEGAIGSHGGKVTRLEGRDSPGRAIAAIHAQEDIHAAPPLEPAHIPTQPIEHDGLRAVGIPDPFYLTGYRIQRLIPGHPFELALSSFPNPLQRVKQPVGVIHPLAVTPTAQASAVLRLLTVVSLDMGNDTVFNMHPQDTRAAAVGVAGGGDDFDFFLRFCLTGHG